MKPDFLFPALGGGPLAKLETIRVFERVLTAAGVPAARHQAGATIIEGSAGTAMQRIVLCSMSRCCEMTRIPLHLRPPS